MSTRNYGEQTACTRCGHDIEWHGRAHGWLDRGAGRECLQQTGAAVIYLTLHAKREYSAVMGSTIPPRLGDRGRRSR